MIKIVLKCGCSSGPAAQMKKRKKKQKNSDLWRDFRNRAGAQSEEMTKEIKEERVRKIMKRVKLPEGSRREGYCACALTGCMMKLVFFFVCAVCSDCGLRSREEAGNQWQITRARLALCTVWLLYSKEATSKMMQPNGGWTPRSFLLIWRSHQ